jgi:hypothetical protein
LIVKREEADPASRIPCREGGETGLTTGADGGASTVALLAGALAFGLGDGLRPFGAGRLEALLAAGRVTAPARGA